MALSKSQIHTVFREVNVPENVEKTSRAGYVEWGRDNLYPQFLWYLVIHSPIHQGVIASKVDYIVSGGLSYEGDQNLWAEIHANGGSKYDLDEVAEMLCLDNEVSNSFYIHAKKEIIIEAGKPPRVNWAIEAMDFELIRPNEDSTVFYYSQNWKSKQQSLEKTAYREIPSIFNMPKDAQECLMAVKSHSRQFKTLEDKLTGGFFSIPGYSGGIESILTDIEINFFRLSEVINGYKGGALVYLPNGEPEDDKTRDRILRELKAKGTDRYKQGGISVVFGEGSEARPTVEQVSGNDLDKRYESTESGLLSKIMIAHSVTNPKLFGVMATGAMAETSDEASYARFQKNYCSKRRKIIASSITYVLNRLNGTPGTLSFEVPSLDIELAVDGDTATGKALNAMSPLVANKVLESMTPNEIRRLAKLPAVAGGDTLSASSPAQVAMQALSGKDPIIIGFEACGRARGAHNFVISRECKSFAFDDEPDFIDSSLRDRFSGLSEIQMNILRLISEGKKSNALQDELHLDAKQLSKQINALDKAGYTDGLNLTNKGEIEIVNTESVEVVYTYEKRPDAPDLIGESREFCKEMLRLDRVYTRAEINTLSKAVGRDVWSYRGGWYNNPGTGKNQPSCRHFWLQNLIVKRK